MGLWDHYESITEEHRTQLAALPPVMRHFALEKWRARRTAVAALRDAVVNTAGVLDVMVDLLMLELKQQEDQRRRDALVDFMIAICGLAACAREFASGERPGGSTSLDG